MLKRVKTIKTSCTAEEFSNACVKVWHSIYNTVPSKNNIAIIYAQNALETGNTNNMYNWNIGNLKAVDIQGKIVEYFILNGVWEIVNGKRVVLKPEDPGSRFRSFKSLEDGMAHHLDLLKNQRYSKAWTAVEAGDPEKFSKTLKQFGYYTAPEADYTAAMKHHFNAFMKDPKFNISQENIQSLKSKPSDKPSDRSSVSILIQKFKHLLDGLGIDIAASNNQISSYANTLEYSQQFKKDSNE